MDLEGFFAAVLLLLHWRVVLSFLSTTTLAVALSYAVPWLSLPQAIVLALLGLGIGIAWETRASSETHTQTAPTLTTAPPVAMAAWGIAGATWGLISSGSLQSGVVGLALLGLAMWVWFGFSARWFARSTALSCLFIALASYLVAATLASRAP